MLLDKTGLRKGKKPSEKGKGLRNDWKKMSDEERAEHNRQRGIQMALKFGIGYEQYKNEVDAIKAEAIRKSLEQQPAKIVSKDGK